MRELEMMKLYPNPELLLAEEFRQNGVVLWLLLLIHIRGGGGGGFDFEFWKVKQHLLVSFKFCRTFF
jgi:hypothetical protein